MTFKKGSRYPKAVKEKALAIAAEETAVVAAEELGIPVGTIYAWKQQKGVIGPPRGEKDPDGWAAKKEQGARESWAEARAALQLVRDRLEGGEEHKAKTAALTFAILADKSAMLEQASALAEERKAKVGAAQVEKIADCLERIVRDLELPRGAGVRKVFAHHLAALEDDGAPTGPAPAASEARAELRRAFAPPPPAPAPEPEPVLELEAGAIEEVEVETLDLAEGPVEEDEGEVCPACGEVIPPGDLSRHFEGKDETRLHCPRQDIYEIDDPEKDSSEIPRW